MTENIPSESYIYLNNPSEVVRRVLLDNWNSDNVPLPNIIVGVDIKRINYRDNDWLIINVEDFSENYVDLWRDWVDTETKMKINIGTTNGSYRLESLYSEVERILLSVRKNIGYDDYKIIGGIKKTQYSQDKRKFFNAEVTFEMKEIVKGV